MNSFDSVKLALPKYLKIFTNAGMPVPKAMEISGKLYKSYNTPGALRELTDQKLIQAGLHEKDERKLVTSALRKAGYQSKPKASASVPGSRTAAALDAQDNGLAGSSTSSSTVEAITTPPKKRKRRREDDFNEFLPKQKEDELGGYGSLEFGEITDEQVLLTKSTVVNRAPLMTLWATVVAERLGFQREEALSIASVYTEMNALSKGVSLGIFESGREQGLEAKRRGAQPYIDLMGRRIPLYQAQDGQWRALNKNTPSQPGPAFAYISRAFRQTTPHIVGALRLLAQSFEPQKLNEKGFSLYADFRPQVDGWGKRGEVRCEKILGLRPSVSQAPADSSDPSAPVKFEEAPEPEEPVPKRQRQQTVEEYEAELDQEDTAYDELDLDI